MRIPMKLMSLVLLFIANSSFAQEIPKFRTRVIDTFPGGYNISVADMNRDGLTDIIGLSTNPAALVWYENPTWSKHIIPAETTENIDCAPYDIDHDGQVDIALQSDFRMNRTGTGGLVQWLKNPGTTSGTWRMSAIWSEPTCHRIRWADFNGDGTKELVNAPLMGLNATSPAWNVGVRLQWFSLPENPEQGPWIPHIIDDSLTVLHGISIEDWDGDKRDDLLTASFEGIHLYLTRNKGGEISWEKTKLGSGEQADSTSRGTSEVISGRLKGRAHSFLAAIEPWHGNEVVVYTPSIRQGELWQRNVIDATFHGGHGLAIGDLNNDGTDEIIAGYRDSGGGLYIFLCTDSEGKNWEKIPLDEKGITCSNICAADLNKDGWLDIIAIGAASANLNVYENLGF